jgi:glycosyltransferase involved in cell wall biosynthesis
VARARVSVVVPAHDAVPYLAEALDGLLTELPSDGEVIVVDDGSTDATPAVLDRYRSRVTVLRNESATGPGPARNRGAAHASGDLLAFHDADDLVLPGRIGGLVPVLESEPDVTLVFGDGRRIDAAGAALGPVIPRRYARRLLRGVGPRELLDGSFIYPQALCVRRATFEALGGFGDGFVRGSLVTGVAEDWEFALRASLQGRLRYVDRPVFAYRRHSASVTERDAADCAEANLAMLEHLVGSHPEIVARVGRATVANAIARRMARWARHLERSGRRDDARVVLERAIGLAPRSLRLRWRRRRLG